MLISATERPEVDRVVFERQKLIDRCMGNIALAERLVKILSDSMPGEILEFQDALDRNDLSKLASLAHRMKGAAANMCAAKLSYAAANLERAVRGSQGAMVADAWVELQREIEALQGMLRR